VLKIKDGKGKIIGVLKDDDTEPSISEITNKDCLECDGTGWSFKNRKPPFPKCPKCYPI
jgi:hypothetical protein